ncbi:MAG: cephalosporin hydroxylase family protein [Actinomycetota bacterium]|nr:cephalosporin hydroxylase family protein [Actinomycetota bacterium]
MRDRERSRSKLRQTINGELTKFALRRIQHLAEASRRVDPDGGDQTDASLRDAVVRSFEALYDPAQEGDRPDADTRRSIVNQFHRLYYHDSQNTWRNTSYRGVPIMKCPLDLWQYQEVISALRPDLIIETGIADGGGAYYLGDLCDTVGNGRVVSIDIELASVLPDHDRVTYLKGSSISPEIVAKVRALAPPDGTIMVILDSDHSRDHVRRELEMYAPMVTVGSYAIVEDTNVHGHPALPSYPPGPMEGLRDFLNGTDAFEIDRNCERFMMTFNPSGYLRRLRPDPD